MLLVKTKLAPSKIHGIGLFADEFIPQGTLVQQYIDGFDLYICPWKLEYLPTEAKKCVLKYAYKQKSLGDYILCGDNARFWNHSDNPNLIADPKGGENDVAARDISPGEELTVNYRDFDAAADTKLG